MSLVTVKGEEFIRKILSGERDFSGMHLEDHFDLTEHDSCSQLTDYLNKQDLQSNPINLSGSIMRHAYLPGLNLICLKANAVDLTGIRLEQCTLSHASLNNAILNESRFSGSILRNAELDHALANDSNFCHAVLWGSFMRDAYFNNCNFSYANMLACELEGTKMREHSNFWDADMTHCRMKNADVGTSSFESARLVSLREFDSCKGLESAYFKDTVVGLPEKAIIEARIGGRKSDVNRFIVEFD